MPSAVCLAAAVSATHSSSSTSPVAAAARQQLRPHRLRAGRLSSSGAAAATGSSGRTSVTAMSSASPSTVVTTTTTPAILKKLQNGSDVRGVALPGVEGEPVTLNEEAAYLIGAAFIDWLADKTGKPAAELTVGVGRDPRLSGEALANALFAGFASKGCGKIYDMGLATTPACFMSTVTPSTAYDAGIMLTASHLPFNRNGMKFFTSRGGLDKRDIAAVCDAAAAACEAAPGGHPIPVPGTSSSSSDAAAIAAADADAEGDGDGAAPECSVPGVEKRPFLLEYAAQLRELIVKGADCGEKPLEGMKIIVDAGNGSGGFFAEHVLQPLGADTAGSQFLDPDGTFPNHSPNPEDAQAMDSAVAATKAAGADLGVIFDTDVDRSAVIDAEGNPINRNKLIALLAAIILREHPGTAVVTDSVTSDGLAAFIAAKGGTHVRYMRGYKNVIDKGVALDQAGVETHLMIETSGHGAMKENHNLDDGAYIAVKIIIEAVRRRREAEGGGGGRGNISDLLAELKEPLEESELRLKILSDDFKPKGAEVLRAFEAAVLEGSAFTGCVPVEENFEGYRVRKDEGDGRWGWFLLRQSLHDPVMVLNFESEVPGGVKAMAEEVSAWFKAKDFADVDASKLHRAVE